MAIEIIRGGENAPITPLLGASIAIVGYGNQGAAQAQNLRDSGLSVIVGQRPNSAGWKRAEADGFEPLPIAAAAQAAALVIVALPDEIHGEIFATTLHDAIKPGAVAGFLHGFSIRYGQVTLPEGVGVVMVAPKGPGTTLRRRFEQGLGLPCLLAIEQDTPAGDAEAIALAWAGGIGAARAGIIRTTFAAEAETDLFGEQAVLCGGMTSLILAAFEILVEAGYPPELAYIECCHEAKQVADLVYERGLAGMTKAISNTAEFGTYASGPKLVDEDLRQRMKALLDDVQNGAFAKSMMDDHAAGAPWMSEQREKLRKHPIEAAGALVRELMTPPRLPADTPERPVST